MAEILLRSKTLQTVILVGLVGCWWSLQVCSACSGGADHTSTTTPDDKGNTSRSQISTVKTGRKNESIRWVHGQPFPNGLPFIVRLEITFKNMGNYICTGTLVALEWILTAGHCVQLYNIETKQIDEVSNMLAYVGERNVNIDDPFEQKIWITACIAHDKFQPGRSTPTGLPAGYNIAMCKLSRPIKQNNSKASLGPWPAILPERYGQIQGAVMFMGGYGYTDPEQTIHPSFLTGTFMSVPDQHMCALETNDIANTDFCTVGEDERGYISMCGGDDGSPAIHIFHLNGESNKKYRGTIYGVGSFGTCTWRNVFTDVRQFVGWIKNIMKT